MGIYDRDYYRREGPSFLGSFANRGQVCKWLILINIAFFVLQIVTQQWSSLREYPDSEGIQVQELKSWFTDALLLNSTKVLHGQVWRLVSYAFLHDPTSLWHILFNLLFLWWFGSEMEDLFGSREFLCFYLAAAVAGGAAYVLASKAPWGSRANCIGASGAVTAVMVLFALHYPSRLIYVMFFLPVPVWLLVIFQIAQDSFIFLSGSQTGTAVTVHLGGAAFGFAYQKLHWRISSLWPDWRRWYRQRSRPKLRVYHEEEPGVMSAAPRSEVDEHLEAKMDAVLEKVARSGRESLTENELQILLRASEVMKKKRT